MKLLLNNQLQEKIYLSVQKTSNKPTKAKIKRKLDLCKEIFEEAHGSTSKLSFKQTPGKLHRYIYIAISYRNCDDKPRRKNIFPLGKSGFFIKNILADNNFRDYLKKKLNTDCDEIINSLSLSDHLKHLNKYCKETQYFENNIDKFVNVNLIYKARVKTSNSALNIAIPIFNQILAPLKLMKAFGTSDREKRLGQLFLVLSYLRFTTPGSLSKKHWELKMILQKHRFSYSEFRRGVKDFGRRRKSILKALNEGLGEMGLADTSIIFYDVTNFYFEIDHEHDDIAYGHSKENRNKPIIALAIAMNKYGIPIFMYPFKGNTADCKTLIPVIHEMHEVMGLKDFIIVADKAFNTAEIVNEIANELDENYLLSSKSKGKSSPKPIRIFIEEVSPWKDKDAVPVPDEVTRASFVHDRKVKEEAPLVEERVVCEWNHNKAYLEQEARGVCLEKLSNLSPQERNSYTTKNKHDKYLRIETYDKDGNIIKHSKRLKFVDDSKVERDRLDDGCNTYVTNDLTLTPEEISKLYKSLVDIEDLFRTMKTVFKTRPFYVHDNEAIIGLLLISFIGLVAYRLVRYVTDGKVTVCKFQEMLQGLKCHKMNRQVIKVHCFRDTIAKTLKHMGITLQSESGFNVPISQIHFIGYRWFKKKLSNKLLQREKTVKLLSSSN